MNLLMSTLRRHRSFAPGSLVMAAMLVLTLLPQLYLYSVRGEDWRFPYVDIRNDQLVYAAYTNALTKGHSLHYDPYTGREHQPGVPASETFLSIQFVPAYVLSFIAHTLGMPVLHVFVLLRCITGLASTFVLFRLIKAVTGDERLAAAASLCILCMGATITSIWPRVALPFLRLYEPAFAFPLFFVFCIIVWRLITNARGRAAYLLVALAGITFAVLVFSYFYLWTAAAAWMGCLFFLWLAARPEGWSRDLRLLTGVGTLAALSLIPYFLLLMKRTPTIDTQELLRFTHRPTVFNPTELIGLAVFMFLAYGVYRGFFFYKDKTVLFSASFALLPAVVFNQQVITGRSLQPFHYELFIANYCALLAIVLTLAMAWRRRTAGTRKIPASVLLCCALVCFGWGAWEAMGRTIRFEAEFKTMNDARKVALRLAELGYGVGGLGDNRSVVLATDHTVAKYLPTVAPQNALWTMHMYFLSKCSIAEDRERFFKYFYYTDRDFKGTNETGIADVKGTMLARNPSGELNGYSSYIKSFDRNNAATPLLSYIVTSPDEHIDFSNLDKWYERDAGEQIGKYILYRVRLR